MFTEVESVQIILQIERTFERTIIVHDAKQVIHYGI